MRTQLRALALAAGLCGLAGTAPAEVEAQDDRSRVTLAEVIPALAGSELGALDLGPAPAPGNARVLGRAEIQAALRAAGRTSEGLAIPRSIRIERRTRALGRDEIAQLARPAIEASVAPCEIGAIEVRSDATLPEGDPTIRVEGPARPDDGPAVMTVVLTQGAHASRVTAQVRLTCPAAVVRPGSQVRVVVRTGAVVASADGITRQSGRVGDRVRVHVTSTGAFVEGRVVSSSTVEVVR